MNNVKTYDTIEQLNISSERILPAAPFPHEYVHCIFDTLEDAAQAVLALRAAGYDAGNIHLMASWDFAEAIERKNQRQESLAQSLTHFFSSMDFNINDAYLHEARRGRHILAVHVVNYEQVRQVSDLLAKHHAQLVKYVDVWTVAHLVP
ncbi:MAG TPA: hypothetical protein VFQ30_15960 [Ktedonobacteraceae bacterium]|nr:hypothetical protein [Ktedonobacteraceae bacterium]